MNNIISYPLFFNGLVKLYKDQKKVSRWLINKNDR